MPVDEECKHGLPTLQCSICREPNPRSVVYTDGGDRYHSTIYCENLISGQNMVKERGGTPSPIRTGHEHLVRRERKPCRLCVGFPT